MLTSFFYFKLRGKNLLLLYAGCIWVESAELLGFLPSKNTIRSSLVFR